MCGLTYKTVQGLCAIEGVVLSIEALRYHRKKGHLIPNGICGRTLLFDESEVKRFISDMRRKSRRGLGARHG